MAHHRLGVDCLAYVRSSSDEQGESCKQQIHDLERTFWREGVLTAEERLPVRHAPERGVFVDDGVSGWKNDIEERAGSLALLEHCRRNPRSKDRPGRIYIWALSRLGRFPDGPDQAIATLYTFRKLGWWVRSITQKGLDADDGDRLLRVIRSALEAEKDTSSSEEKSRGVSRGKRDVIEQGKWQGGSAPFGYDRWAARGEGSSLVWVERLPGRKRNGNPDSFSILRPSEQAEWVRQIFSWYADGDAGTVVSMSEIARRLEAAGVTQSRAGSGWGHTIIAKILQNETYVAEHHTRDGATHKMLWEPLVDRALWTRAQRRHAGAPVRGRSAKSEFLLSGLAQCLACGVALWGEAAKSGRGYRHYYRAKPDHHRRRSCVSCRLRLPVELLDGAVLKLVASLADRPEVIRAVAAEQAVLRGDAVDQEKALIALDQQFESVRQEKRRLVEYALSVDGFAEVFAEKQVELNRREERLVEERRRLSATHGGIGRITEASAASRRFGAVYDVATPAERKELVRAFIARVAVDGDRGVVRIGLRHP